MGGKSNWTEVSASAYEWEREALDFVRERLPAELAYRAWSNFEFIDHDGSINEVDLLIFSPKGAFLVEIKSWPERTFGDSATWQRDFGKGRRVAFDNPLLLANRKAKRLKGLLDSAYRKRHGKSRKPPFLAPLVFLSHPGVSVDLDERGRDKVCVRDREDGGSTAGYSGVLAATTQITTTDRQRKGFRPGSTGDAKVFASALEAVGIRETTRHRRAGEWELGELLEEGQGWQEFEAARADNPELKRRVRVFGADSIRDRSLVSAAARREFQILDPIEHPGILVPKEFVEAEQGPSLIYPADASSVRLDHFLATSSARLTIEQRLSIVRQIGEALMYAHARDLSHRTLRPSSILITDPEADELEVKVRDWHVAHKETGGTQQAGTLTANVDLLVEEEADVYLAPEAGRSGGGDHLDVFSLGAISFLVFSGQPPADSIAEREKRLMESQGLDLAAVMDGAGELQRLCVMEATSPVVEERTHSVKDFLQDLDDASSELKDDEGQEADPTTASKHERLGEYEILARLGRGGTAIAYLVQDGDQERVLKVAASKSNNERIREEAEVLSKVRDVAVVKVHLSDLEFAGHAAILIDFAGRESLADRLRDEGPPELEVLERWGEDLLRAVSSLEEQGVAHRDIKPENIGVKKRRPENSLRLTLYDFSLSRAPLTALDAGTPPYLDPFIRDPGRGKWDLSAERFALAMTLHEVATGQLPRWGDGLSDPFVVEGEVDLEPALFDPAVAEPLCDFFRKALARSSTSRFDSAEEMLRSWRECFTAAREVPHREVSEEDRERLIKSATPVTSVGDLPISRRSISALRSAGISNVAELLSTSTFVLKSLTGVGSQTRGEILDLHERLSGRVSVEDAPEVRGLDLLARQLVPSKGWDDSEMSLFRQYLGLEGEMWKTVAELSSVSGEPRAKVERVVTGGRERWYKSLRSVSALREEIADQLKRDDGFLPVRMLENAMLARRGAVAQGDERRRVASACVRASVDAESLRGTPRFGVARNEEHVVVSLFETVDPADALEYLEALGEKLPELVIEEPVPVSRVAEDLRAIAAPGGSTIPPERLTQLAVEAGHGFALNDRGEVYPRNMSAATATERSAGVLVVGRPLDIKQIHNLVSSRYRHTAEFPDRPELDGLLEPFGLKWDDGEAKYCPSVTLASSTVFSKDKTTEVGQAERGRFDERLESSKNRVLTMTARSSLASEAEFRLVEKLGSSLISLDELMIEEMKVFSSEKGADWAKILEIDADGPEGRHWNGVLLVVAAEASRRVEQRLMAMEGTILISRVGLLARYGQLGMISKLKRQIEQGSDDCKPEGLWLLLPTKSAGALPKVDGNPLPVLDENEWTHIPSEWIKAQTQ